MFSHIFFVFIIYLFIDENGNFVFHFQENFLSESQVIKSRIFKSGRCGDSIKFYYFQNFIVFDKLLYSSNFHFLKISSEILNQLNRIVQKFIHNPGSRSDKLSTLLADSKVHIKFPSDRCRVSSFPCFKSTCNSKINRIQIKYSCYKLILV